MSNKKDSLGDRMKAYEAIPKNFLMRRTPVIIRLDGKAFHSFTKGFHKPFDTLLMRTMHRTMKRLCEEIQGCVLGYTQSDEITLILCDYQTLTTDAWFGYNIEKMTSVAASMATLYFNQIFADEIASAFHLPTNHEDVIAYHATLCRAKTKGALFDARVFSLPKKEVNNCLVWRQQDAIRNSIQAVAQSCFPHKELQGLSTDELIIKLIDEKNINWTTDFSTSCKKGCCCVKKEIRIGDVSRKKWTLDYDIPTFSMRPDYVNNEINFEED